MTCADRPRGSSSQPCTQLPAAQTDGIQQRAATHTSDFEKHNRDLYGSAAWQLLRDAPDTALSDATRARKAEPDRKFPARRPTVAVPPAGETIDMSFRPPIDIGAVRRMTDEHLLNAGSSSRSVRPLNATALISSSLA
jgi:hypothetical protein